MNKSTLNQMKFTSKYIYLQYVHFFPICWWIDFDETFTQIIEFEFCQTIADIYADKAVGRT